ncbi:hypothetical protein A3A93_01155 [Candidatus Roizmanbacteria bacterium RIFCSPLOWO2_01_FULL_38_12]|uniref:Uncharacterized protein n=1 Tax=Candidatus Roizmanbacteria bacterium RIFCSPLOWO2_01_FULL_38_12 TaxID=1802061 RepID=A0A1F7IR34_9BACT|nr:MAG: hypothetical protein A3F59_02965 [Candidatus Roizmanbacteria bacterium RIFCSPHIGHO2_12_FULL_38_13]OGK45806.1 MAG: hypothetical protein A3A93_01155 [Candidatus Roizmanbacteria bacterium RIFCSPLOWO2_01_FULL_38_12]
MNRLKISKRYKYIFSEKVMDLGNISAGALVFSQFISGKELSLTSFLAGIILLIVTYFISLQVAQ